MKKDSDAGAFRKYLQNIFKQFSIEHLWAGTSEKKSCRNLKQLPGSRPANLLKKETLAQVFSCEFCEISKNTFSYRTSPVAASKKLAEKVSV